VSRLSRQEAAALGAAIEREQEGMSSADKEKGQAIDAGGADRSYGGSLLIILIMLFGR
jgi:hypothetical protein